MLNEADFLPSLLHKTTTYQQYQLVEINVVATLWVIDPPPAPLKKGGEEGSIKNWEKSFREG
jgi:hypothetical protein